jgi:hypothetical protein
MNDKAMMVMILLINCGYFLFELYCESMTPTAEIAIPNHWRVLSASRPISHAIKAATTGMRAENMLDFATPSVLIVPT